MIFLRKYMNTIKLFLLFILINCILSAQSNMFWNKMGVSFNTIIKTYGNSDKLEYQETGEYWLAYDYGNKDIVYVVNKGIVTSIMYIEHIATYNDAKIAFIKLNSLLITDGFTQLKTEQRFFEKIRNKILIQAKIIENFDSFIIAMQIKNII